MSELDELDFYNEFCNRKEINIKSHMHSMIGLTRSNLITVKTTYSNIVGTDTKYFYKEIISK